MLASNVKKFITRISLLVKGKSALAKLNDEQLMSINDVAFFRTIKIDREAENKRKKDTTID